MNDPPPITEMVQTSGTVARSEMEPLASKADAETGAKASKVANPIRTDFILASYLWMYFNLQRLRRL
jgi:hypothetical protein